MKKILLPLFAILLTLTSVFAISTINVSFFQDQLATQPYLNEFMFVYAQHKTCQSYYLGGMNCTYDCRNGRYASGIATIPNITDGLVWDLFILQPASFDNATACPRIINPVINYQFDQKIISTNESYNYFLNETILPTPAPTSFNFRSYLIVGWWILTLIIVIVAGYYTMNGWACVIALVIMIILKLILFG